MTIKSAVAALTLGAAFVVGAMFLLPAPSPSWSSYVNGVRMERGFETVGECVDSFGPRGKFDCRLED